MVVKLGLRMLAAAILVLVVTGAGSEEFLPVLLGLTVIIISAKICGAIAQRFDQPSVLGELTAGIILGNLDIFGFTAFEAFSSDPHLLIIAELGVLLLLFEVGLESTVGQMLKTGVSSLFVAVLGVAAPLGLGWLGSALLLPDASWHTHVFVGATLTATSVGITARVLKDLGHSKSLESRTILGAAVIDDVLGLVTLAVVVGSLEAEAGGEAMGAADSFLLIGRAGGFLLAAILFGVFFAPRLFSFASRLRGTGLVLALSMSFCLLLSWGAGLIGLAPIIGAFAAGLVLEEIHFRDLSTRGQKELEELIHPIVAFLTPVFFVTMGMRTDLRVFADPRVLFLAGSLIVIAILSKQAAALGVLKGASDKISRLTVGIGMIPRGEVGLIFANYGLAHEWNGEPVLPPQLFSALVVVVLATTMITPPLLKYSIARSERKGMLEKDPT